MAQQDAAPMLPHLDHIEGLVSSSHHQALSQEKEHYELDLILFEYTDHGFLDIRLREYNITNKFL